MCDKASECIMSIMAVSVLVYKSFCNTVCINSHANKACSCCCCLDIMDGHVSQRMLAIIKTRSLDNSNQGSSLAKPS